MIKASAFLRRFALCAVTVQALVTPANAVADDPPPSAPVAHAPSVVRIEPGMAWHLAAKGAKPGDQILLEKGIHINGRLEDLHGTREKPIVIRGADLDMPTAIACEATGIELVRCSWVRIENLFFINPHDAAILIDGTTVGTGTDRASDAFIAIAACRISTDREMPELDAIRIINARTIGIADCAFESWSDAAIELRGASNVVITRSRFTPIPDSKHTFGIRALDRSDAVTILQNTFDRGIKVAVQVGRCLDDGSGDARGSGQPEAAASADRGIAVARCAFVDIECPIEVAGQQTVSMSACTVVDPVTVYRIDARCGRPSFTLGGTIIQWSPGRMDSVADRRGDATPDMVRLGENLWWSIELPAALEVVGRPFGNASAAQIFDIDPKLSDPQLEPQDPRAHRFGWLAPLQAEPDAPASSARSNPARSAGGLPTRSE